MLGSMRVKKSAKMHRGGLLALEGVARLATVLARSGKQKASASVANVTATAKASSMEKLSAKYPPAKVSQMMKAYAAEPRHLSPLILDDFREGRIEMELARAHVAELGGHVLRCERCQQLVRGLDLGVGVRSRQGSFTAAATTASAD
jgi:hypothetical protein